MLMDERTTYTDEETPEAPSEDAERTVEEVREPEAHLGDAADDPLTAEEVVPSTEEQPEPPGAEVEPSLDVELGEAETPSAEEAAVHVETDTEQAAEEDEAAAQPEGDIVVPVATDEETEEDEEEEELSYMFQLGEWYVVHTYAGYENKVKANLASRIQSMNMEDKIYEVVVPTEEVMELKSGKMQSVQKKVFPGYILVRMELDDDSWYVVRNTPGVTGFVGPTGAKPVPLDPSEVAGILAPKAEERPRPQLEFEQGEVVSVVGGAFNGYSGPVSAIDVDKQRVTVLLDLFGRETPVELTFDQVTKL
jgi:transcriptional antiterminator NusG